MDTAELSVIPWYKAAVVQRLALAIVVQIVAKTPAMHFLVGVDLAPLVNDALEVAGTAIAAWALHARITKPTPPVAISKMAATRRNLRNLFATAEAKVSAPITAGELQCAVSSNRKEMSMNFLNTPFLGGFAVDLLTGAVLEQGTNGDKTKQAARATEALALIGGFKQILSGDAAGGINAAAAAIQQSTTLSIGESMAIQNLILLAGNQAALLQNVAGVTILGQANAAILNNVLAEMTKVCDKYIAAVPAVAAKPAA